MSIERSAVDEAIRLLWVAFSDLDRSTMPPGSALTDDDVHLWFKVTTHPAIKDHLDSYLHPTSSGPSQ